MIQLQVVEQLSEIYKSGDVFVNKFEDIFESVRLILSSDLKLTLRLL